MPPGTVIRSSFAGWPLAQNRCGRPRGRGTERAAAASKVSAAADGQVAAEHVEALIFPVMDMQRRPGCDGGLKDAQGSAGGMPRRFQAFAANIVPRRGIAVSDVRIMPVAYSDVMVTAPSTAMTSWPK